MTAAGQHTGRIGSHALEAGPRDGDNLVRLVYLDEGGVSRREPLVVVAGVIINADKSLIAVEDHLDSLIEKYIPAADRAGFVFHATELWSGTRYFKDRDLWPLERRLPILDDLVRVPKMFDIPIVYGTAPKEELKRLLAVQLTDERMDVMFHTVAFLECVATAEGLLRDWQSDEIAMLIAENRDSVRKQIKLTHQMCRQGTSDFLQSVGSIAAVMPFKKIRDAVHFADKTESKALQIADVCCFIIKGYLNRVLHNRRFFEQLRSHVALFEEHVAIAE